MGGLLGVLGKWLFGGGGSAVVNIAQGVDQIVDNHVADVKDRAQFTKDVSALVEQSQASARSFAAPGVHNTAFDALVDGFNRLIRPGITLLVVGSWVGWWQLNALDNLSSTMQWLVYTIIGFWFGSRFLAKDVPASIVSLNGVLFNKPKGNTP